MRIYTDIKISSMGGFGPVAWNRDDHYLDIISSHHHNHAVQHRMNRRRHIEQESKHPEDDCELNHTNS